MLEPEAIVSAGQHVIEVARRPYFSFIETLKKKTNPEQTSSAPFDKSHPSSCLKYCKKYFYVRIL